MKIKYGCDICNQYFEEVEDAMRCEKSHEIVYPTTLWFIPVVGIYLYAVQILKGNFVKFPKNEFGTSYLKDWILASPFILLIFIFIFFII
jgi:hypothetical protein